MTHLHRLLLLGVLAAMLLGGCEDPATPIPLDVAERCADAADGDAAALHVRLLVSLHAAGADAVIARLGDPNERLAVAAAGAAARLAGRDAAAARKLLPALAQAARTESRPAALEADVESIVSLLANREKIIDGEPGAMAVLAAIKSRPGGPSPAAAALAEAFVKRSAESQRPSLGGNVYDGPGCKLQPPPTKPGLPVAHYEQKLHTVPIVAAGEVRVGDCTGDGADDYLVVDTLAPDRGGDEPALDATVRDGTPVRFNSLHMRATLYDHRDPQVWSVPLVGDDRPLLLPAGPLPDLDGDGLAEIVYVDRAGRIVVRNGKFEFVRRSEPFRTLDGEPYFAPPAGPGQPEGWLRLANFRGRTGPPCDLLLTRGPNLLALNDQFQVLWHVRLAAGGSAETAMLVQDLDGDGRDEIVRDGVAIDEAGRTLWSWPVSPVSAVAGRLAGLNRTLVVLLSPAGRVAGFDMDGQLWQAASGAVEQVDARASGPAAEQETGPGETARRDTGRLIVGRFAATATPGSTVAIVCPGPASRFGAMFDGLGRANLPALRATGETPARLSPPVLVADWNRDGLDEVWGRDGAGAVGWLRFGTGEPVERVPQATRVVGLVDTNNDGEPELLYFQGESLVVHRR